jgi:hypothetical protein
VAYAPPKRSWRRRLAHSVRSWTRVTFSRESYISSVKSLLWVVPLTVLIWVYAEREQVTTLYNVSINVAPPPSSKSLLVRFAAGTPHMIHAEIHGPQSSVDDVKELLEANTIPLDLDRDRTPGDHLINIANELNKDPRIIAKGVEIRNCSPADVIVTLEPITPVTVDVKPRPEDARGLPQLVFVPDKVTVFLPESELKKARDENRLYVYPNLKAYSDVLAQSGEHSQKDVAVGPAFDDPLNAVSLTPPTVEMRFNRSSSEDTYDMPTMVVFAAEAHVPRADEVKPEFTTQIEHVGIIGPKDLVEAVRNGTIRPNAAFNVDYSGNEHEAHLYYDLPKGLRVADKDANRTIPYKLVPRTGGQ